MNKNLVETGDGSFTLFSEEFEEHYHSTKDGAFTESLYKHINFTLEAYEILGIQKEKLVIFDSNFGLGFNTFTTIYKILSEKSEIKLDIYSTEIDKKLIYSLKNFKYPDFFETNSDIKNMIQSVSETGIYRSENINIYVYLGDTLKFLETHNSLNLKSKKFDFVFQDAFSPLKCPQLWTKDYFCLLRRHLKQDSLITTYSTASQVRKNIFLNGLNIFRKSKKEKLKNIRNGIIATFLELPHLKKYNPIFD